MPTYQYACTACREQLEAVQSFSDAALTECPACGGRLRKVYSAVGVVFKGSGFYKNDSRKPESDGKPAEKKVEAGASSDKASGSDKGSSSETSSAGKGAGNKESASSSSTGSGSSGTGSFGTGSSGTGSFGTGSSGRGSSGKGSSGSSGTPAARSA